MATNDEILTLELDDPFADPMLTIEFDPPYIGTTFSPVVNIYEDEDDITVTITDSRGDHSYTVPKTDEAIADAEAAASAANSAATSANSAAAAANEQAASANAAAARANTAASTAISRAEDALLAADEAEAAATEAREAAGRAESGETARATAESARASAEANRVSAEASRVDAEASRVSAEQAREAYVDGLAPTIDALENPHEIPLKWTRRTNNASNQVECRAASMYVHVKAGTIAKFSATGNVKRMYVNNWPSPYYEPRQTYFHVQNQISSYENSGWVTSDYTVKKDGYVAIAVEATNTSTVISLEDVAASVRLVGTELDNIVEDNSDALRLIETSRKQPEDKAVTTLLHCSDIHWDAYNLSRIMDFAAAAPIDDVLHTGDMVLSSWDDKVKDNTGATTTTPALHYWWDYAHAGSALTCIGNHDLRITGQDWIGTDNQPATADAFARFFAPYYENWGVTWGDTATPSNAMYYYKDYNASVSGMGVRLIVLDENSKSDSSKADYHATQIAWLEGVLADALASNLGVIVAQHYPFRYDTTEHIDCSFTSDVMVTNDRNTVAAGFTQAVADFVDDGGEFVCWLSGHLHSDLVQVRAGRLMLSVTTASSQPGTPVKFRDLSRNLGERNADAFNVLTVDRANKKINVVRVGADCNYRMRPRKAISLDYATCEVLYDENALALEDVKADADGYAPALLAGGADTLTADEYETAVFLERTGNHAGFARLSAVYGNTERTEGGVLVNTMVEGINGLSLPVSTYFPDGMKAVGIYREPAHDRLTPTAAVQRVGVKTITSGMWTAYSSGSSLYYHEIPEMTAQWSETLDRVWCDVYPTTRVTTNQPDNTIRCGSQNRRLYLKIPDGTTLPDSILVYYQLETPIETPIDPPLDMTYRIGDGGVEAFEVPSGVTSTAPTLSIASGYAASGLRDLALAAIAPVEGSTASTAYAIDSYLVTAGRLRRVTSAIAAGGAITSSNTVETDVMSEIVRLTQ